MLVRQREAFRRGDAAALTELCRVQSLCVEAISDLERTRKTLVIDLNRLVAPDATQPLRMAELAERLPEPARGRLLVLRSRLVTSMQHVQEQSSVLRRAGDAMIGHVSGLIRTIGTVTRGGHAYGLTGRSHPQPAALRSINLTA